MVRPRYKGVEIRLIPGARIPVFIRSQDENIEIESANIKGQNVRILRIRDGEAMFFARGSTIVRMPGSSRYLVGFDTGKVLAIVPLPKGETQPNWYLCPDCYRLTGRQIGEPGPTGVFGQYILGFECTLCHRAWTILI